jgi:RNA polymerase sigma-70 factor (ECF subfamily)
MTTMTLPARGPRLEVAHRGGLLVATREGQSRAQVEAAVREVYDAHYGRLAGWATKLVSDPDLAHDLATEAFLRLVREFGSVDDPRAWLYTVTANLVRDHWRKRGREASAYERHQAGILDFTPAPDQATTLTVREAVLALPDRLRVVVLLHYFADLPVATVARQLEKSEGTVKRDLFDARHKLAQILGDVR